MILLFSLFLLLLCSGMPIMFVLGVSGSVALLATTDAPIAVIPQRIYGGLDSFTIMAIPFFVACGVIMEVGGISRRIVEFASACIGWVVGSLLHVSIVTATVLAAMSGSGSADAAAVATIMAPELKRQKYDVDFGVGMIASAGCLAQIIPPSLMMVVVAIISNISIGALFLSGFFPGLITSGLLIMCAYIHARRGGPRYRQVEHFSVRRLARTFWAAVPALGMPVIVLGGIVGGVFTPTEAACVAMFYGLSIGYFVYGELRVSDLREIVLRSATLSGAVMILIGTTSIFGWLVADANIPALLGGWFQETAKTPWAYLLLINVVLALVGCFMESLAAILILVPIIMPIAIDYGIHPVHFGLVVVMNFAIGMITPPYGIALYVASTVADRDVLRVGRRNFWPWVCMISALLLITYVPEISLYLPRVTGFLE